MVKDYYWTISIEQFAKLPCPSFGLIISMSQISWKYFNNNWLSYELVIRATGRQSEDSGSIPDGVDRTQIVLRVELRAYPTQP